MFSSPLDYLRDTLPDHRDKVVYSDENSCLTFAQVADLTLAVSSYLLNHTAPGSAVVVMTGRHVYTPVAYLGVAGAGCFYIPMDASLPVSRLNSILSVAQAGHMIVDQENLAAALRLDYHGNIFILENMMEAARRPEAVRRATEQTLL